MRGFLKARGIEVPEGSEDEPGTVRGIAAAKNARFLDMLRSRGPELRPGAEAFLRRAREAGLKIAVVTASRNGAEVLEASGLRPLSDALVDGNVAAECGLAGKPRPDTFLEAARRLDTAPERAAVVEDAVAGVRAGKEGGFGLVLGMGPEARRADLEEAGADAVVPDLS